MYATYTTTKTYKFGRTKTVDWAACVSQVEHS